jgi:hypothetical protein
MMTPDEWQQHVSKLSSDAWHKVLYSAEDYQLWIASGRPDYPRFSEIRGKHKTAKQPSTCDKSPDKSSLTKAKPLI